MNCDTPSCTPTADVYRSFSSTLSVSGDTAGCRDCCDDCPDAHKAVKNCGCCAYTPLLWNEILSHHIDG